MGLAELFLVAVGLSMDAFAVAVCKGLNMSKINYKRGALIALFFGVFQALMPLIGWILGIQFEEYIVSVDHWVAFVLLGFIGGKMIIESMKLMNEVTSDFDGTVEEILVSNGDAVEYDQPLMRIV